MGPIQRLSSARAEPPPARPAVAQLAGGEATAALPEPGAQANEIREMARRGPERTAMVIRQWMGANES